MLGFLLSILACEPMANPGNPFSDEPASSTDDSTAFTVEVAAAEDLISKTPVDEASKTDGAFADPQDTDPIFSSAEAEVVSTEAEPVAEEVEEVETEVVAVAKPNEVEAADTLLPPVEPSASTTERETNGRLRPARIQDGWSPTLVSTISSIPIPKAVITMPSGKDIVVQPGDILKEEGVVVMSIGQDSVELAIISNAGGSAAIQNLTLHSQIKQAPRGEF